MEPTLFSDRDRRGQMIVAGLLPAIIGAVAGILLGVSSGAYWAIGALAALGALVAGFEHLDVRSAAIRGLIAGAVYGVALLLAHAIAGTDAKVSLGSFPPFLVVITAVIGALLTAAGAWLARGRRDRAAPTNP
jgi:apolipoprotein N-acyltransferase